jgi:monoamine oxidase
MASPQDATHTTVLILGGGVSGITAAKTLAGEGITNFKIIEARDELGGRLRSERFGERGREVTVEVRWYSNPSKSLHRILTDPLCRSVRIGFKESAMEIA